MALFKISKGLAANLPATYNEGWCYFTTDDGKFYIDTAGDGGSTGTRVLLNGGVADHLIAGSDWFQKGISIPSNSDLNNYYTVGKYYCNSGDVATTLGNCPTSQNFTMLVLARTSSNTSSLTQIILSLSGEFFMRSCPSNNTWRDWTEFLNTSDFNDLETKFNAHTHTVTHKPAGSVGSKSITPAGSVSSDFTGTQMTTSAPSATSKVASSGHTHSFTPAGTVSTPAFTGTEATISATYTPAGTNSAPAFTGTAATISATASGNRVSVYSITGVGSVATLTASVSNRCLTFTFGGGSVPTRSAVAVATSTHTHSYTPEGTVAAPVFTGTEATISTTYTPEGTNSSPKFTGTAADTGSPSDTTTVAGSAHTHTGTPEGTIVSAFTGTAASHNHSFTGTEATLTTTAP